MLNNVFPGFFTAQVGVLLPISKSPVLPEMTLYTIENTKPFYIRDIPIIPIHAMRDYPFWDSYWTRIGYYWQMQKTIDDNRWKI